MINKVILIGRLGKDPEGRTFENGNQVANFNVATSESFKDKGGTKKETTEWHNISAFGKSAEIAQKFLKKGSLVYIEGKLKTRSWEKDGATKYITEIVVDNFTGAIRILSSKNEAATSTNEEPADSSEQDDLPF